jgi:predicted house-cleaning noncanonical NTP pyrophosphatase (MazG superfamily)
MEGQSINHSEGKYQPVDSSEYPDDAQYAKIVRDNVVEELQGKGFDVEFEIIEDPKQITDLLIAKITEEAEELKENPEKAEGELADLFGILRALAKRYGIDFNSVISHADDKLAKRGEYDKGILLKRVTKRNQ